MDSLESGRYLIRVELRPGQPSVGGTNFGGPPVVPVVADGPDKYWTVIPKGNGNYTLALFDDGRYAREEKGNVVAAVGEPAIWHIRPREGGLFTIEVPHESKGWSLYDTRPNAYVAVGYIGGTPEPGQLWRFIRTHE